MVREYQLFKTAKKTARVNGLMDTEHGDVYYDISILDEFKAIPSEIRERIAKDIIRYNVCSWFEQPIPIATQESQFAWWHTWCNTSIQRVFKSDGRRIIVIISVNKIHIEKWARHSVWEKYNQKEEEYDADTHYVCGDMRDIEVA